MTITRDGNRNTHGQDSGGARTVVCKGCGGTATAGHATPAGWYGLTVSVPPWMITESGKSFLWVGLFCSVACLASSVPELAQQEQLAHQVYEPVIPQRGAR